MASLFSKVTQFANSPKGKQVIRQATTKAQQLAKDPKTRAKIDGVRQRLQGGRNGQGPGPAAGPTTDPTTGPTAGPTAGPTV